MSGGQPHKGERQRATQGIEHGGPFGVWTRAYFMVMIWRLGADARTVSLLVRSG